MRLRLAVLVALQVVLSRFFSVQITEVLKFSFGFIPIMLTGALYGWPYSCLVAGLSDVIGAILFPQGPFFIGYTLTAVLTGLLFGLFFHKKDGAPSAARILIGYIVNALIVTVMLNTFNIAFQYGYLLPAAHDISNIPVKFLAFLPKRALEAAVMLPVQFTLTYLLLCKTGLIKMLARRDMQSDAKAFTFAPPPWLRFCAYAFEAAFISVALSCDLGRLVPQDKDTALTRYVAEYVFTDNLFSALAFVFGFLLVRFSARQKGSRAQKICALLLAAAFTLSGVFGNIRAIHHLETLWLVLYLCVFLGAYFLFYALCAQAFKLADGFCAKDAKAPGLLRCWLILFLCALPYLIVARPGTLTQDAYDQLNQFMGTLLPGEVTSRTASVSTFTGTGTLINDTQPVLHTLLLGSFYALFRSLGSPSLGVFVFVTLQTALLALAEARCIRLLSRLGAKKGVLTVSLLFYALFPLYPLYAAATLKETALAVALLSAFEFLAELFVFPEETAKSLPKLLAGGISILIACLIRSFALWALLLPSVCALIHVYRRLKRGFLPPLCAVLGACVLFVLVNYAVYPLAGVGRGPGSEKRPMMINQLTLALEEHADDLNAEEYEFLSRTLTAGYSEYDADPTKDALLGRDVDWKTFDGIWLKLGLRYPLTYLRAALAMDSLYWDLRKDPVDSGLILYLGDYGRYEDGFTFENPRLTEGVVEIRVSDGAFKAQRVLRGALMGISRLPIMSLLFKCGTYLSCLVIALAYLLKTRRRGASLLLTMILWGVGLAFGPISGSSRYAFPIIALGPFLTVLSALLPARRAGKETEAAVKN